MACVDEYSVGDPAREMSLAIVPIAESAPTRSVPVGTTRARQ